MSKVQRLKGPGEIVLPTRPSWIYPVDHQDSITQVLEMVESTRNLLELIHGELKIIRQNSDSIRRNTAWSRKRGAGQ